MRNEIVQFLVNAFRDVTTKTVDVKDAYKVFKWKYELKKAAEEFGNKQKALSEECFENDEERQLASDAKAEKSPELIKKIQDFNEKFNMLLNEETSLDVKTVSYESWHNLLKENDLKLGYLECELENILFKAPEEE